MAAARGRVGARTWLDSVLELRRNEPDLDDVPKAVRADLTVHLVEPVDEVLRLALEPAAGSALPAAA